jgi:hypothetical protein
MIKYTPYLVTSIKAVHLQGNMNPFELLASTIAAARYYLTQHHLPNIHYRQIHQ